MFKYIRYIFAFKSIDTQERLFTVQLVAKGSLGKALFLRASPDLYFC